VRRETVSRTVFEKWAAPAFMIALVALFAIAPWGLKAKLDAVCFGI